MPNTASRIVLAYVHENNKSADASVYFDHFFVRILLFCSISILFNPHNIPT